MITVGFAYQVIQPVRTFGLLALVRFLGLLSCVDVEAEGDGLLVWALELELLSAMLTIYLLSARKTMVQQEY